MVNITAGGLLCSTVGSLKRLPALCLARTTARSLRLSLALNNSPSSPEKEKIQAAKPLANYCKRSQVTVFVGAIVAGKC